MRGDEESICSCLARDIVWHEPDLASEHTGELAGPDAVLAMSSRAQEITGGTFLLRPRQIVANGEHAVALVDWSALRGEERLAGKEVAVYRIREGRSVEASFHQDDPQTDREFWEADA